MYMLGWMSFLYAGRNVRVGCCRPLCLSGDVWRCLQQSQRQTAGKIRQYGHVCLLCRVGGADHPNGSNTAETGCLACLCLLRMCGGAQTPRVAQKVDSKVNNTDNCVGQLLHAWLWSPLAHAKVPAAKVQW